MCDGGRGAGADRSVPQYRFSRSRVRQSNIFERLDPPLSVALSQDGEDQRVDLMGTGWMGSTGRQAAPAMHDRRSLGDLPRVDQLVAEGGVPVDRLVYWAVESHDLLDPSNIVPEPVHEC